MTRVSVLTPAGSGAIATVALDGPAAWEIARLLFRPVSGVLPDSPSLYRLWFGRFGETPGDEVVLAVVGPEAVEIHCHGGRRVVRWVVEQCCRVGAVENPIPHRGRLVGPAVPDSSAESICRAPRVVGEVPTRRGEKSPAQPDLRDRPAEPALGDDPWTLLERAPTLRTANILLDQCHGAFAAAVADLTPERLASLVAFAPVGRHLIDPWRVVIAGPPNVGKSSLVNALAGYQRVVVSPLAGTTRDAVTTAVAFGGWPVELTDTAGLRDAADPLEAEGVARGRRLFDTADLVIWLTDATDPHPPDPDIPSDRLIVVANKVDLAPAPANTTGVSARTGTGVAALTAVIAARLVPFDPPPGAAVPYTPALAGAVVAAARVAAVGGFAAARDILTTCPVPPPAAPV